MGLAEISIAREEARNWADKKTETIQQAIESRKAELRQRLEELVTDAVLENIDLDVQLLPYTQAPLRFANVEDLTVAGSMEGGYWSIMISAASGEQETGDNSWEILVFNRLNKNKIHDYRVPASELKFELITLAEEIAAQQRENDQKM